MASGTEPPHCDPVVTVFIANFVYPFCPFFFRSWAASLQCGNGESGWEHNTSYSLFSCLISLTVSHINNYNFIYPLCTAYWLQYTQ